MSMTVTATAHTWLAYWLGANGDRKHPANPCCRFAQAQATGCQRCGSNSPILL